MIMVCVYCIIT